jgi:hypothetical protein
MGRARGTARLQQRAAAGRRRRGRRRRPRRGRRRATPAAARRRRRPAAQAVVGDVGGVVARDKLAPGGARARHQAARFLKGSGCVAGRGARTPAGGAPWPDRRRRRPPLLTLRTGNGAPVGVKMDVDVFGPIFTAFKSNWQQLPEPVRQTLPFLGAAPLLRARSPAAAAAAAAARHGHGGDPGARPPPLPSPRPLHAPPCPQAPARWRRRLRARRTGSSCGWRTHATSGSSGSTPT